MSCKYQDEDNNSVSLCWEVSGSKNTNLKLYRDKDKMENKQTNKIQIRRR